MHRPIRRLVRRLPAAVLVLAAWARPALAQDAEGVPLPVTASVGHLGAPVRIGQQQVLAYELRLGNHFGRSLRLDRVEVLGPDDELLASHQGPALAALAQQPPVHDRPSAEAGALLLEPGHATLLFLFLERPAALSWPAGLRHRLHWSWQDRGAGRRQAVIRLAAVSAGTPLPALDWPLQGGLWLAANGPANESEHRRTVTHADGVAELPQRYAYDLVEVDAQGRLFSGRGEKPADWIGFGRPLLAVADGVVVMARDGIDDNESVGTVPPSAMNVRNLCGNGVSLRLDSGRHVVYCHLKKGSVMVRPGQAVARGDRLGQLGNSGNSDAPHLHLHLSTQAHPMRGEGEPMAFGCQQQMGRVPDLAAAFAAGRVQLTEGGWVSGQAPGMNDIVRLPGGRCP